MKIQKSSLKVAILIIPWFTFAVGMKWPVLGIMINAWRVIVLLWSFMYLIDNKRIRNNLFSCGYILPMSILYGILLLSTIINNQNTLNALQLAIYGIWPFIVMSMVDNSDEKNQAFLEGIVIAFSVLTVINMVMILAYPEGIYTTYSSGTVTKYYLFGAKNQMVAPLMTAFVFFLEYSYRKYQRMTMRTIFLCGLCIIEIIIGGSGTGILMVASLIAMAFYHNRKRKGLNSTVTLAIVLTITVGFVVLRLQNLFDFIIVSLLHKSLTLSNRVFIWDTAIEIIKEHPYIGTGVSGSLAGNVLLNLSYLSRNTFSHNMYLDYLVMGGIGALVGFFMNLYVAKKQYDSLYTVSRYGKTYVWEGIIVYLIASIVEIYTGNYCLFMMMSYIASLQKHKLQLLND